MAKVSFEIGGRKLDPCFVGNPMEKAMLLYLARRIRRRIGALRDPLTGKAPSILVKGDDFEHLSYEVDGSQHIVERVKAILLV
jgi:hypothetical protein